MSDGCGESKRNQGKYHAKGKNNDEFALAVAKVAVAQVCETTGFQAFQQSALEMFSDVAVRYIQSVGKAARSYANSNAREESNAFDIIQGLEDLGSGLGFAGASDVDHCLASSGVIREMVHYVEDCSDVPFAYSLPRLPVVKDREAAPSFRLKGEEPPFDHIPSWLPAFPDPETYGHLATVDVGKTVSQSEKIEPVMQQKKSESPVLNLHAQVACNGFQAPSSADGRDSAKSSEEAIRNPYLASPLHIGEKQVSQIVLPSKFPVGLDGKIPAMEKHVGKHVSVVEAFAPAIEAVKTSLHDLEDTQKNVTSQRPAVHFRIGSGKKTFGSSLI